MQTTHEWTIRAIAVKKLCVPLCGSLQLCLSLNICSYKQFNIRLYIYYIYVYKMIISIIFMAFAFYPNNTMVPIYICICKVFTEI